MGEGKGKRTVSRLPNERKTIMMLQWKKARVKLR